MYGHNALEYFNAILQILCPSTGLFEIYKYCVVPVNVKLQSQSNNLIQGNM